MAFDKDLVNDVLKHANIVDVVSSYLNVVKKGKDYVAVCPFHDDTNPSLHINPDKQICKCFVCGTGGSAISFVQKYEHIPFWDALRKVAELSNYQDPRLEVNAVQKKVDPVFESLTKCTHDLTVYYQYALGTEEGKAGLDYFEERHLDSNLRNKYLLGYAFNDGNSSIKYLQGKGHSLKTIEDIGIASINGTNLTDRNHGRVIFPICNENGDVVGYSARRIKNDSDEAKYVNSPETKLFHKSSILYNYHIAKEKARIDGYIYVLEGFMDVFALSRIGIDSAVAIMGTALTNEHIQMLRKLNVEVRVCLDGDLPGQTATLKIAKLLTKEGINFRIVDNAGSNEDPDEILNNKGEDALRYYLNNLLTREDFALNYYKRSNPLRTIEEKKAFVKEFIPILLNIKTQLELDSYLRKISDITGFEAESIRDLLKRSRRYQNEEEAASKAILSFNPERKTLQKLDNAERELLYQMLINVSAIKYFEQFVGSFYDSAYRQIASFIIECYKEDDRIDPLSIISMIEMSDLENSEELIKEVTTLMSEKNHPIDCTEELLNNLNDSITKEKENIFEKEALEQSMKGKSPLEQARILNEYNKRRAKKELNDTSKEEN